MVDPIATPLDSGESLLRAGPRALRGVNGEDCPPAQALDFGEVEPPDRGYPSTFVCSFDWEKHEKCGGCEGVLQRRPSCNYVYQMMVDAGLVLPIGDGIPIAYLHWPEDWNLAHSHVLFSYAPRGKSARRTLLRAVRETLALFHLTQAHPKD